MNLSRVPLFLNWSLIICTAAATVYLGIRNAELESRCAVPAAFVDVAQRQGAEDRDSFAAAQELRTLRTQLASLQRDLEDWKGKVMVLQAGGLSSAPRVSAMGTKPPLTDAAVEEATRLQRERKSVELLDNFLAERVDPAWSKQMTEFIEKRFADSGEALMQARLMNAECRSTLCRIEVLHESHNQQTAFEFSLPMLVGAELPGTMMFTENKPDGSIQQVVYLSRRGYHFP